MLVFILLMGEYLIPALLGGGKVFFVGNALVDLFLQSRNWPFGSAVALCLVGIMLVAITLYLMLLGRERGRQDVSINKGVPDSDSQRPPSICSCMRRSH